MYICFSAMKEWFQHFRKFIGLDGCFLKGPHRGQILCSKGVDANNGLYPLGCALVEGESIGFLYWFSKLLFTDMGIDGDGEGWTIMSDKMKGILDVVKDLKPKAEHMICVRHMELTWRER